PGSSITLTGLGFSSIIANNTVTFRDSGGGRVAGNVTASTPTTLTGTVPATACANADVDVTVAGQTSKAKSLVISNPTSPCSPTLTDIVGSGAPGDVLLLEGTGFDVTVPSNNVVRFTAG